MLLLLLFIGFLLVLGLVNNIDRMLLTSLLGLLCFTLCYCYDFTLVGTIWQSLYKFILLIIRLNEYFGSEFCDNVTKKCSKSTVSFKVL